VVREFYMSETWVYGGGDGMMVAGQILVLLSPPQITWTDIGPSRLLGKRFGR